MCDASSVTLPFGASASVHNFLRVSAFLQAAGCALGLLWTSYFDDFPMVSHAMHTTSTLACAKGLMSLFGFVYSEEKLAPFDYTAEILGVVVDLSKASQRKISISNKPSRVEELNLALRDILESGVVVPNKLPSVLGKLQYADSHVWGRAGKLALADLRELGHTAPTAVRLGDTQIKAFEILQERLCGGKPKAFIADDMEKPVLLFTDGALEYDTGEPHATIGAVCLFLMGALKFSAVKFQAQSWTFGDRVGSPTLLDWLNSMLAWWPCVIGRKEYLPGGSSCLWTTGLHWTCSPEGRHCRKTGANSCFCWKTQPKTLFFFGWREFRRVPMLLTFRAGVLFWSWPS